jgi:superfamily II DNA or RNA helicase
MAGGGASATRVNQRIGRTIRTDKFAIRPKDKSIVIIYEHDSKFLGDHSLKVRRLLKKEPEFKIINSKGTSSICNEVDELLGFEPIHKNLFDAQ